MNVHFISIGGSAMHNLALALHLKGFHITGSDDEIFEPSRTRLLAKGLLPEIMGWFPDRIHNELDAVILGMHARKDNPELIKAQQLGLRIYSYPEYLYEQSKDKLRVVIGGSHGKTTVTAMILHVLHQLDINCDYMVGAKLEGFDVMVKLSHDAKIMIFEGDEYLTSPIDSRPKFHLYKPHIALLTGIAWDHMNVFPTFDVYLEKFTEFIHLIETNGHLVYYQGDEHLLQLALICRSDISQIPYQEVSYHTSENGSIITENELEYPLNIFGRHNMQNLKGAMEVCKLLGITENDFLSSIQNFRGASNRLEKLSDNGSSFIYKDFAHAPSKVAATTRAVKEQFPNHKIIACLELHTYSSLNIEFLPQYAHCLESADIRMVYFSKHALEIKKLPSLDTQAVKNAFNDDEIMVFNQSEEMLKSIRQKFTKENTVLLMMSSGNYDGISLKDLATSLI
ncbi:MAG: Mur ligase family protein [Bacteroidales bacterium]|jgi:UDP-N-acetylmuramate: L-alanyl-gamma-D-glutamyl-meso-diaminopimelate ligase|nr:Mur ligase family protein [Bacteroidales bacterium]